MPAKTKTKTSAATAVEAPVVAAPSTSQIGVSNSNIDQAQVLKAFKALHAHIAKRNNTASASSSSTTDLPLDGPSGNLRDPSNTVLLQITLNNLSPTSHVKPVRINLPHALHTPGEMSVCLLVKDPQREYKDLLTEHKIKCISRVVGVTKLKGKFKPFDARRALVQDHDMFLADARIVPTLPNLCGKVFFDAKKNPITVDITKKSPEALRNELEGAIKATTFLKNKGSCSTVKIGYMQSHSAEQLTENLVAALPAVLSRVKGGWENVHNIDVKTGNSAALPIWSAKLGVKTHATPSSSNAATSTMAATAPVEAKKQTPSKKRALADVEVDAETPSKKKSAAAAAAVEAKSPVKKVQEVEATPKKPSPRKTRGMAAKAAAGDASVANTPLKPSTATPRKVPASARKLAQK